MSRLKIELKPARLVHTGPIAARIREMDRIECEALGKTPKAAIRWGLATSLSAYTAIGDGKPVAMIGVAAENMLEGRGTIWMLGTDDVFKSGRALMTYGPLLIEMWLERFKVIENIVSIDNARAINLLQRLGFTIDITDVRIHGGVEFIPFWIERSDSRSDLPTVGG
jgi:hypothetical protein